VAWCLCALQFGLVIDKPAASGAGINERVTFYRAEEIFSTGFIGLRIFTAENAKNVEKR